MIRNTFVALLAFLATLACSAPPANVVRPKTGTKSGMYNPASTKLHPLYSVFHNSDNSSILLVKIFPVELVFSDANEDRKLIAKLMISFYLTDITDRSSGKLADSGT